MERTVSKKSCTDCDGSGLVKKKVDDSCLKCKRYNFRACFYCENRRSRGLYEECSKCYGSGETITYTKNKAKKSHR